MVKNCPYKSVAQNGFKDLHEILSGSKEQKN
jgi:hypothetical protein